MIKKIMALLLAAITAISVTGCAQGQEDGTAEAVVPTGEISAGRANIGISTKDGGYYDTLTDITVVFGEDGEIEYGYLENPTLLAFKVGDNWPGGVYIYSGEKIDDLLAALNEIAEAMDEEAKERLLDIIEELESGGPIEGAST